MDRDSLLDFDLTTDLIVITAQVGDEYPDYVEFRRISSVGTFDRKAWPIFYLLSLSL
jgi:hypothetical protein